MRIFRLFVDKYSSGYQDLFLKIDVSPSSIDIADSYYLYDFFEIDDEEFSHLELKENQKTPYIAIQLLKFWKQEITNLKLNQETFLPFNLYDEGGEGYIIKSVKNGFEMNRCFSESLSGWRTTKSVLGKEGQNYSYEFHDEKRFVSEDLLIRGIEFSIKDLMTDV